MKIYFANHKYISVDFVNEEYRRGYRYLNFGITNFNISFDSLFNFLSNKENLIKITVVDNDNNVLADFNNIYHSVSTLNRNIGADGTIFFNVQLSSTEDGIENIDEKNIH